MTDLAHDRAAAWEFLCTYTTNESLRKHALCVEAAMRSYAAHFGEDVDLWGVVGLIHDFDYELHPTAEEHPALGAPWLRERGYDETIIRAILSHGDHLGIPRQTLMEKTLYAVDELCGFIVAVALVRPTRSIFDVTPEAVRKKMKDKAFARAVRREDIIKGAAELGVDLDEHIGFVTKALQGIADEIGLRGVPQGSP
jgi:putative nucleotidyltransferase with HDIG domain